MRTPSRRMPKYVRPPEPPGMGWARAIAFAAIVMTCLIANPLTTIAWLAALAALIAGIHRTYHVDRRQLVPLIASRQSESICEFARSFDCRRTDTWVIRAVYEELQDYHVRYGKLPIRATDLFESDLLIDDEELDYLIAPAIAERTGRSMEYIKENPYAGKVRSVADLVRFFNLQPRLATQHG